MGKTRPRVGPTWCKKIRQLAGEFSSLLIDLLKPTTSDNDGMNECYLVASPNETKESDTGRQHY